MLPRIKRQIHRPAFNGRLLPPWMQQLIRRQQIDAFTLPPDSHVAFEKRENAALLGDQNDAGQNDDRYYNFAHGETQSVSDKSLRSDDSGIARRAGAPAVR
jgi:hypothetical protein